MKMKLTLLFISGFLLFQVHAFLPSTLRATLVPPSQQRGPAAFASTSRRFFTPKIDDIDANDDEPFLRPALHNSSVFRSVAILWALLFAIYQSSNLSSTAPSVVRKLGQHLIIPPRAAATVHLLSFATWFGTVVYTTFIAGITMFRNLPRRVFGKLQSKLFPLYFRLCSALIAVQILTLTAMPDILSKTSEVSLAVAFFTTLLNLLYLEPKSTRVMFERYTLEDDGKKDSEEYGEIAKLFGKLHGISSLTNLVALCGGVIHGCRLASGLSGLVV